MNTASLSGPAEVEQTLLVRSLGLQPYEPIWRRMRAFTDGRHAGTPDEVWLLEHEPVYTLGQAGKAEHLRDPGNIAVIKTDRGGQITYHGPGQLVVYLLIDLKRRKLGVRALVDLLENAVIALLAEEGIAATAKAGAPGVYVQERKISSLGLRVRRGCTYHGLSFNLRMNLTPFAGIDVCGYQGLAVTQLADLVADADGGRVRARLVQLLQAQLGYRQVLTQPAPKQENI